MSIDININTKGYIHGSAFIAGENPNYMDLRNLKLGQISTGRNNRGGIGITLDNMGNATGLNTINPTGTLTINGNFNVNGSSNIANANFANANFASDINVNGETVGRGGGNDITNTAVGSGALSANTTGIANTAMGDNALTLNTTGVTNTAVGSNALALNTNGTGNTAVGSNALRLNTNNNNTAVGVAALASNTTANGNTAVGAAALLNTTGSNNTAMGNNAGTNITSGSNNTCIGANSNASIAAATNEITLGDNNIATLRCNVQVITALSDARDKKNINDLNMGLDFINDMKPRVFNWDKRDNYENNISDGSKISKELTTGFIAQELDELQIKYNADYLKLVYKSNPDKIEATYGNLLPVIVKAIQELSQENLELKKQIKELQAKHIN